MNTWIVFNKLYVLFSMNIIVKKMYTILEGAGIFSFYCVACVI